MVEFKEGYGHIPATVVRLWNCISKLIGGGSLRLLLYQSLSHKEQQHYFQFGW